MDSVCTSEATVHSNETTRRYIPEDSKLHTRWREREISHTFELPWIHSNHHSISYLQFSAYNYCNEVSFVQQPISCWQDSIMVLLPLSADVSWKQKYPPPPVGYCQCLTDDENGLWYLSVKLELDIKLCVVFACSKPRLLKPHERVLYVAECSVTGQALTVEWQAGYVRFRYEKELR
jgi:hypothetical protein